MNLFNRRTRAEPMPAPAPPLSEFEIAEAAVKAADARIAAVSAEFQGLVKEHQLLIDRNGQIVAATLKDVADRAELETLVRTNLRARDEALGAFYRALSIYAGLKGNNQ
jgi:hypothetical protein